MADQHLVDLTALTAPAATDLLYVVADPAGTPVDRKLELSDLPGYVLDYAIKNDATQQAVTAPSVGDPTAVHADLAVTFTVPASGNVEVSFCAAALGSSGAAWLKWSLLAGTTPVTGSQKIVTDSSGAPMMTVIVVMTGLTPGDSHTWTWAHSATGGSCATRYGGINGAAVIKVVTL